MKAHTWVNFILILRKVGFGRHILGIVTFLQAASDNLGLRLEVAHSVAQLGLVQVRTIRLDDV